MNHFDYCRRQSESVPRWRVTDPDGAEVALCASENAAVALTNDLNELRELRILLAVASKTLAVSQACAMLGCTAEQLQRKIGSCLARGWK